MLYTLRFFFSSKCSLFHNSNVFGSCIIHILYTGVLKLKKNNNSGAKRLIVSVHSTATSRQATSCSLLYVMCKLNRELQYRVWFQVAMTLASVCLHCWFKNRLWLDQTLKETDAVCQVSLKHIDPRAGVGVALRWFSWTSVKVCRQCCSLCEAVALTGPS